MTLSIEVLSVDDWPVVVAERLNVIVGANVGMRLCLATGETTRPLYRRTRIVGKPQIFLLDEFGGLPLADAARCAAMLRRDLPNQPFHAPDVDAGEPVVAAEAYSELIDGGGLDLAVVGLGRNGHLGMNEPGSTLRSATRVVDLADSTSEGALTYGATVRPWWGITVGIEELMEARELWLVVTGAHKTEILRTVLEGPIGPDIPATFLRDHANALVLADAAAAGQAPSR